MRSRAILVIKTSEITDQQAAYQGLGLEMTMFNILYHNMIEIIL